MTTPAKPASGRLLRTLHLLDRHPSSWLLLGGALLVASQLRFSIAALAWLAPIPWLRHLRVTSGWRARTALVASALLAWELTVLKIVTAPLPWVASVGFALPIGLSLTLPYLLVPVVRRRLGEGAAVVVFGTLMVSSEWLLHVLLPFGTWGSAANTQLEQLALLQLSSVTGLHGVSLLVYLVASSLESLLATPSKVALRRFSAVAAVVLAVVVAGEARLVSSVASGEPTTRVAAIGTDSTIGAGPLPSDTELAAIEAGLFERTSLAARAGASLVVWTEAATMVRSDDETAFLARVGALARDEHLTIVVAYVVPRSLEPLRYFNRYALITPQGAIDHVYDKHHPVPGEPAVPGTGPMPVYQSSDLGRVSGAICYDYDFPRLGLEHAESAVDLVALPSSDWRGIDPIHTQMAALRAIEGGHSVLRSTRFGLSAGFDRHGRPRSWLSHFDDGNRVMVVSLPRYGFATLYGMLGDWLPIGCLALSALAMALAVARRRRGQASGQWYADRRWPTQSSPSPVALSSTPASASASTSTPS